MKNQKQSKIFLLVVLSAFLMFLSINDVIAKTLRTYIVAGQSNADGFGLAPGGNHTPNPNLDLEDIGYGYLVPPNPNVKIFKGAYYSGAGSWSDMSPVFGFSEGDFTNRFGPELSFGYEISNWLGEEIAVIKFAQGATELATHWDPLYAGTNQYDYFLTTIANAQAAANAAGDNLDIIGVAWMQGESDALVYQYALDYEDNLEEFIATLRAALDLPDLQFYVATIRDFYVWTYRSLIWQAQSAVAENDPEVYLVTGSDLSAYIFDGLCCNGLHYDTQGQVTLGQRFAATAINNMCIVTLEDLRNFASHWLSTDPAANLDGTGSVDMNDFSVFVSYWQDYCPNGWQLK